MPVANSNAQPAQFNQSSSVFKPTAASDTQSFVPSNTAVAPGALQISTSENQHPTFGHFVPLPSTATAPTTQPNTYNMPMPAGTTAPTMSTQGIPFKPTPDRA